MVRLSRGVVYGRDGQGRLFCMGCAFSDLTRRGVAEDPCILGDVCGGRWANEFFAM